MTDFYHVLSVEPNAKQDEIRKAFDELLAVRRRRRVSSADLHAAWAVLGDPALRRAFDLARLGEATGARLVRTKESAAVVAGQMVEMVPDIDVREFSRYAWQATLRGVVLTSGLTANVAEITSNLARRLQSEAMKRIVS